MFSRRMAGTPKTQELQMGFKDLNEMIDFAIEKEEEAADFYASAARQEDMAGSRKMFEEFASEELKHKKMLEDFKKGSVDDSVKAYKLKWITDIKRSDYMVDVEYHHGMNYREILHLAMKREEKALAFYNFLLANTEDETIRKLLKILCQEEARHKLALETMYDDFMAKMGD